ncbi:MAG: FAD-dependent oxidoreductase [Actinobacteria bacterium]|nr:FAD-dependent oxidoreductase [Actinomycetota bacterium]
MTRAASSEDPVIVVGAGLSGLATAIGVAENGRRAVVLEADELVGGAAAYSGGQVWIGANHIAEAEGLGDDPARVEAYVRGIAHHDPELLDEEAMLRWLGTMVAAARYWEEVGAIEWTVIPGLTDYHSEAEGAFGVGRYLTNRPIDGRELGEWQAKLRRSPHFPVGVSYDRIAAVGRRQASLEQEDDGTDPLTFGTGVVAMFLRKAIAEDRVEILPGHRVVELLQDDDGAVAGAVAETSGGRVEFHGPVVLATSSYDWNQDLVEELLGIDAENFGSVAPKSIRGDGIALARSVGGDIGRIPGTRVPMLPGWPADNEPGFTYGPEYALPGAIIVDEAGKRFCDDSYYISLIERALDPEDPHLPCFMVFDERHHRTYGLGTTPPGGEYDRGLVSSADTLAELGEKLGIDGAQLERTVARFNEHADDGEDPDFGRGSVPFVRTYAGDPSHKPNALLGSLSEGPFHGMRLHIVGTGIGSSGVHIDGDGHVLDGDGAVIDGLYAVGACAALLSSGTGYNSGFALGRGLTLAYLAAHELAGSPIAPTPSPAG